MEIIKWFRDISKKDISSVGGKGANLGEMYNIKLPIPPGFVVTAQAYKSFLEKAGIKKDIEKLLSKINIDNQDSLHEASEKIQELILNQEVPDDISLEIKDAYDSLDVNIDVFKMVNKSTLSMIKAGRSMPFVAVRSSATAEDLPEASFAGQQATYLNVKGSNNVVNSVKKCWASLFTARAIYYREKNNFPHSKVYIAVVVQKMINGNVSGIMFTANPSTNNENEIMIEAGYGLGEAIVSGGVNPNNYIVNKDDFIIKHKEIKKQNWMIAYDEYLGRTVKKSVPDNLAGEQALDDHKILEVAKFGFDIENHYKKPMDIEFTIEGSKVYILQARPITTLKKREEETEEEKASYEDKKVILTGLAASPGVITGKVKLIKKISEMNKIEKNDILVTVMTNPDMVPAMERASGIITDEGGATSHAAIVSRELGIPCVVGTEKATSLLKDGQEVTVDGSSGKVYSGAVEIKYEKMSEEEKEDIEELKTKTKIYMNLGEPDKINEYKNLPFEGIGLMRIEFIITSEIGKHPLYVIKNNEEESYIDKLASGISKVASIINPKPVIVRFSDFKTNEYRDLEGGEEFEEQENNPMIGFRGASRYISQDFVEAFKLECRAIRKAREENKNVHVMIPMPRNVGEIKKCLEILKEEGLERSKYFQIYLMGEVPSIALIPDDFASLDIDGVSIGSNDLTQLVLGVDRDSAKLGKLGYFNENDKAVLQAMSNIIRAFKMHGKKTSICGQAPSVYPEIVEFLVKQGIDAISVNPDAVLKVRKHVSEVENQ